MTMDRRTILAAAALMPIAGRAASAAEPASAGHPMRRKDRQLSDEETLKVIKHTHHAVLATVGPDGTPYAVPVTPLYLNNAIYFHTASDPKGLAIGTLRPTRRYLSATSVEETSPATKFPSTLLSTSHPPSSQAAYRRSKMKQKLKTFS